MINPEADVSIIYDGLKWIPIANVMAITRLTRSTLRNYSLDQRVGFPKAKKFFGQNFYRADEIAAWFKRFRENPMPGTCIKGQAA